MKKLLVLVLMSMLFSSVSVLALDTSTYLQPRGDGSAALSTLHEISGVNSARLYSPFITGDTNEGRVRIEFPNGLTLANLNSISWMQYVESGYASHVDVFYDNTADGVADDTLVFEYAKVDPADCDDAADYPTGAVNTFDDKGIVDVDAYAWLSSGPSGPCGDAGTFDANHKSLADWKLALPTADVIAIEIEVDGWIGESEAFIDDVTINGELVEDFEGTQSGTGQIIPDMTFIPNPNPLNFGSIVPGESSETISTLSVGNSNLEVTEVSVASTTGTVFTEANVLFSTDAGATFESVDVLDPFGILAGGSFDLHVQLNVPVGTGSEPFSGIITYTVLEDLTP